MDSGVVAHLAVVIVASRLAAEIAERAHLPAVVVEILAGVLIGPAALHLVRPGGVLGAFGELGVVLLLFETGRQMDLAELTRVGGASLRVAAIGVVVPMAAGFVVMRAFGFGVPVSVFVAAGLTATSVGITARVFGDLRALASAEARTVLGAAVADDVIGLVVLAAVLRFVTSGDLAMGSLASVALIAVGFVVVASAVGAWAVPRAMRVVSSRSRADGTLAGLALALALIVARTAEAAHLAPIVGAFVAGLAVARSESRDEVHRRLAPLEHLLVPIFFLGIGIDARPAVFADPRVLTVAAALCVVAIVGKIVAGAGVSPARADRVTVGLGMIPRGEVGLIFASIGRAQGILGAREYGALVAVVLATTLAAPPLLRHRIARRKRARAATSAAANTPSGGWLTTSSDDVELAAEPPAEEAACIALRAAVACASRRPGPHLVEWLARAEGAPGWDAALRSDLAALLSEGNERSWRFLEITGFLGQLLPEIAAAPRRNADGTDLLAAAHWETLAGVQEIARAPGGIARAAWDSLPSKGAVFLAALARDAFAGLPDAVERARRLATSVGMDPADAGRMVACVAERHLLPAAAARARTYTEEEILDLAVHLGDADLMAALYVLAVAEDAREPWERERLDELHALVRDALARPEVTGAPARAVVELRRAEVRAHLAHLPDHVRRHLDAAPRRYLLAQPPAAIERHLRMIGTPPGRNEVRLHADPGPSPDEWTVHLVFRDRAGALAAVARALSDHGVGVRDAFVSTWIGGLAVDVFHVMAEIDTDWDAATTAIEHALSRPQRVVADATAIDALVEIDNRSSPWHSRVEVYARDRAGLLWRVAAALSRARLEIQHASVETRDGVAVDTFWVTGRGGGKLDETGEKRLRAALSGSRAGVLRRRRARTPAEENKVVIRS